MSSIATEGSRSGRNEIAKFAMPDEERQAVIAAVTALLSIDKDDEWYDEVLEGINELLLEPIILHGFPARIGMPTIVGPIAFAMATNLKEWRSDMAHQANRGADIVKESLTRISCSRRKLESLRKKIFILEEQYASCDLDAAEKAFLIEKMQDKIKAEEAATKKNHKLMAAAIEELGNAAQKT